MVERVIDYLLVPADPAVAQGDLGSEAEAGSEGPITLTDELRIESADQELAERLLRACELRGERWDPPRLFGVAQPFVREVDFTCDRLCAWDEDQTIYVARALSRLIRPHATTCDYAGARRAPDPAARRQQWTQNGRTVES